MRFLLTLLPIYFSNSRRDLVADFRSFPPGCTRLASIVCLYFCSLVCVSYQQAQISCGSQINLQKLFILKEALVRDRVSPNRRLICLAVAVGWNVELSHISHATCVIANVLDDRRKTNTLNVIFVLNIKGRLTHNS